jgi:crotonobetainyl-CoA:carnitine CoA-transferase CaiB-like acyl-CoA transferase
MAGMYAATAILAAIVERGDSGKGQHLDIPLYDSQVAWLANQNMNFLVGKEVPGRLGTAHPNLVPYQAFRTADGYLMLAIGNDPQFVACCECLGIAEVGEEKRFASNEGRVRHRDELVALLSEAFAKEHTARWLKALASRGVPAGPINTIGDVLSGDYAAEREFVRTLPHASGVGAPSVANPVRFSRTAVDYRQAPPMLGEHTDEVLADVLGLDEDRIGQLRDSGAI